MRKVSAKQRLAEEGTLTLLGNDSQYISLAIQRCPNCHCMPRLKKVSYGTIFQVRVQCSNPACDRTPTDWMAHSKDAIDCWVLAAQLSSI